MPLMRSLSVMDSLNAGKLFAEHWMYGPSDRTFRVRVLMEMEQVCIGFYSVEYIQESNISRITGK